jgi:hypothetical protein
MTAWQGLYDDVIGTTYALSGTPIPISRKVYREMQKRGNYAVSQNLEDAGGTAMVVPSTRKQSVYVDSDLGGARTVSDIAIVAGLTDAEMHTVFDVRTSLNLVADLSGNGGGAF